MHMKYLVRIHLASRVVVLLCVAVSSYSADETCKSNTFTKSSAAPTVTQKRDESDGMRGMRGLLVEKLHFQNTKVNVRKARKRRTCICLCIQKKNPVSIPLKSPLPLINVQCVSVLYSAHIPVWSLRLRSNVVYLLLLMCRVGKWQWIPKAAATAAAVDSSHFLVVCTLAK